MNKKRLQAYLVLTFVALIWGVASPVIKYTLDFIPPYSFLFWRFLITSIVFLPFFIYFVRKSSLKIKDLPWLIFLGFLGTPLTLILIFEGYTRTTSTNGVLISATAPIFIALGGAIFLKETVTKTEKIGLLIASIGSLITVLQPFAGNESIKSGDLRGNLLIFASVISWTAFTLLSKQTLKKHSPFILTALGFFVGLLVLWPFFNYEKRIIQQRILSQCEQAFGQFREMGISSNPPECLNLKSNGSLASLADLKRSLGGVLYMSIFSSVIAYSFYTYGLSLIEASEASLFAYLQPIFATPVALVWLNERVNFSFVTGAVLITLGVILSQFSYRGLLSKKKKLHTIHP